MAKIIKIEDDRILIGLDDGGLKEALDTRLLLGIILKSLKMKIGLSYSRRR